MSTPNAIVSFLMALGLLACSASDEAPFGGRVDSPTNKDPKAPAASSSLDASLAGVHPGPPYPTAREGWWPAGPFPRPSGDASGWPPRPSTWWDLKLTPLEKVIADTCPSQPWSQYVPDINCTKHSECGDGFCDRGHCNATWTCARRAGLPCEKDEHCRDMLCIEGRCQSCLFDEECQKKHNGRISAVCSPPARPPFTRSCGMLAPRVH